MKHWQFNGSDFDYSVADQYFGFVYEIRFATGHFYIGRKKFTKNWKNYEGSGHKLSLFKEENPDVEWEKVIVKLFKSNDAMKNYEDRSIKKFCKGHEFIVSDMFCLNMQITHGIFDTTGTKLTQEHKDKIARKSTGRKHTEESKRKMSRYRKRIGNNRLGFKHSEETKIRISMAHMGKTQQPNTKEQNMKISASLKGRFCGREHSSYGKTKQFELVKNGELFIGSGSDLVNKFGLSSSTFYTAAKNQVGIVRHNIEMVREIAR